MGPRGMLGIIIRPRGKPGPIRMPGIPGILGMPGMFGILGMPVPIRAPGIPPGRTKVRAGRWAPSAT